MDSFYAFHAKYPFSLLSFHSLIWPKKVKIELFFSHNTSFTSTTVIKKIVKRTNDNEMEDRESRCEEIHFIANSKFAVVLLLILMCQWISLKKKYSSVFMLQWLHFKYFLLFKKTIMIMKTKMDYLISNRKMKFGMVSLRIKMNIIFFYIVTCI